MFMQILEIEENKCLIVSININEFHLKEDINTLFSANEIQELNSIKNKRSYTTKKIGLYTVKKIFKQCLGWTENDYTILKNEHGKPFCNRNKGLKFNISHSGDYIIIGFSAKIDLGVDIEKHKRVCKYMNIANRFFHPLEVENLNKLAEAESEMLFFDYWALKESYVKYVGIGIGMKMSSFYIEWNEGNYNAYDSNNQIIPVDFISLNIDKKYSSFLCTKRGVYNIEDIKIINV